MTNFDLTKHLFGVFMAACAAFCIYMSIKNPNANQIAIAAFAVMAWITFLSSSWGVRADKR